MPESARDLIYAKVSRTVAEVTGVSEADLNGQTELIMDLNLDSLALFEIVIELEEVFDLQISDEDVDRIKTLDEIVRFIEGKIPAHHHGKKG